MAEVVDSIPCISKQTQQTKNCKEPGAGGSSLKSQLLRRERSGALRFEANLGK
jgi:hypothetical protein